jgi:LmbE family N-acetylglucosaminyl deacetylase
MKKIIVSFVWFFVFLIFLFCNAVSEAKILVVAPHPDDDVIIAAGITYQAIQSLEPIKIIYITNGDVQGIDIGYLRQGEAVSAQINLGMIEDDLIFLGYPDGYLYSIYNYYINATDIFTTPNSQSTTYGNRGLGSADYHFYRFGFHANYNRYNILLDLEDIISTFKPDHIFFTLSEFDIHPDHSTTYELMRLALISAFKKDMNYTPTIHKTIIHWGIDAWPNPLDTTSYFMEIPNLFSQTGLNWDDRESVEVPLAMQSTNYSINPKYLAVSAHASQGGADGFLGKFIHKDEIFWTEDLVGNNYRNIAPFAVVTASSETPQYSQLAIKAVDGIIDGYPGDYTREWATAGEGSGAWIQLTWSIPYLVDRVVLYDRPNLSDNILSATLSFSDGSTLAVGPLNNGGDGTEYTFPPKVINSLTMTVNTVSITTQNIGLAEIEVFGTPSTVTQYTLTVNVNPSGAGSVSKNPDRLTYFEGEQVTLTATANTGYAFSNWSGDASGTQNPVVITMNGDKTVEADFAAIPGTLSVILLDGLSASGTQGGPFSPSSKTYTLQNTGGTAINWSASNTQGWLSLSSAGGSLAAGASTTVTVSINSGANSLGAGSYTDTLSFTNTTNGNGDTTRAVNLTVQSPSYQNIAPLAAVTASSETPQYSQLAIKAVDGIIDGYPGDYTREWATAGEGSGAWIQLTWSIPYLVDRVVLYDRPNLSDNILSATLSFSDGSSFQVGPLDNRGAGAAYTFASKLITSVRVRVDVASSTTLNIGLSEIEVFGTPD